MDDFYQLGWNLGKALYELGQSNAPPGFARKRTKRSQAKPTGRSYTRGSGKKRPKGKAGKSSDLKTKKSCSKGTACGRTCIAATKTCGSTTLKNTVRAAAEYLKRGTTTSGEALSKADRRRYQDLAKDAQRQLDARDAAKKPQAKPKGATKPRAKSKPAPKPKNKPTPIQSQRDFDRELQSRILSDFDLENNKRDRPYIGVGELRRKFAGRLGDEDFDDYLRDMMDREIIELRRDDRMPSDGAIKSSFGDWTGVEVNPSKIDRTIKPAPPTGTNPVKNQRDFSDRVQTALSQLQAEDPGNPLIPIYQVRRLIGENATRSQFSQMLLKMQEDGDFQLEKGNVSDASRDQVEDSVSTDTTGLRFFIRPLGAE